ncbi:MAG: aldo/keto reductase [Alphaproteobacteria bacterium]|nr:aldo/keto reductase [Alphaproteobacteria bacterium]
MAVIYTRNRGRAPDDLRRRRFLQGAGAAALGLYAAGTQAVGAQGRPAMLTRPIPSSGEALPVVGFGTWQTFDVGRSETERAPLREVLRLLFEAGGKVIDSSPMYGPAEGVVGDLLTDLKAHKKAFYATKVWTEGEAAGAASMERSFARYRSSPIDLMQIHNLVDWRTHMRTLRAWKDEGRFRYIGITHYTTSAYEDLAAIIKSESIDFVQFNYSLEVREAENMLLPLARDRGVATLINRPFGGGGLFGRVRGRALAPWAREIGAASWAQLFLRYILANPAVTCVIPGTGKPAHARDNLAAGLASPPQPEAQRAIARNWERL